MPELQPIDTKIEDFESQAWALLLAARGVVDASPPAGCISLHYNTSNADVRLCEGQVSGAELVYGADQRWQVGKDVAPEMQVMFDLYLSVLGTHRCPDVVVGHLGQSIDARIATTTGDAFFVTGEENRKHLHRMRALSHAVIVGAQTVITDNPQLTTRAVPGLHPVRVVIDPSARVPDDIGLLQDGTAATWLLHDAQYFPQDAIDGGSARRIPLASVDGRLLSENIVSELAQRGLRRLFVEGGGVTVSGFLNANCLHQLQIAVAPLLVGEGRPALQIPGVPLMRSALRPPYKLYRMGEDVLWDFDVRKHDVSATGSEELSACDTDPLKVPSLQRLL